MKKTGMTLAILVWCGLAAGEAPADIWEVPAELWEKPRSGIAVLAQVPLKACVEAALAQPAARILIHHAGGEEPLLQAEELRAWLVALAVEAARIELVQDLKLNQNLHVELMLPLAVNSRSGQGERTK